MEKFPIPNNPNDLSKTRLELRKKLKEVMDAEKLEREKDIQIADSHDDSDISSIMEDVENIESHKPDANVLKEHLDAVNKEAKKYTKKSQPDFPAKFREARERDKVIPQITDQLSLLSNLYDRALTAKYKDFRKKRDADGIEYTAEQVKIDEVFEKIEQKKQRLFEQDPISFRSAEILRDHRDSVERAFVNTKSREEDYEWLVEQHARGNPAILLHGPPGTGKTQYVRHFARSFLGEKPIELVGKPDMRTTELSGQQGMRASTENPGVPETYQMDGVYDKAVLQAKRLGKAVIHFDEIDLTQPAVRMWFKPKYEEMRRLGITVIATGNLNGKSGREVLDSAELREFAKKEVSYMPKEEFFDVCLSALVDSKGSVQADPKELAETLKYFVESVSTIQRDFTQIQTGAHRPIIHRNVIDTGTALRLISGFTGGSLYAYLSKEIAEMIKNTPQTDPKDKADAEHIAKIFAQNTFNIPNAFPDLNAKIQENAKRLSGKSGYSSLVDLALMDPYKIRNISEIGNVDTKKQTRKDILGQQNGEKIEFVNDAFEAILERDYALQQTVHQLARLSETLSTGVEGIKAIDGKEYPFPSKEDVVKAFEGQEDVLEQKLRQYQNPKIVITPFGKRIMDLAEKWKKVINDRKDNLKNRDGSKVEVRENYDMTANATENISAPVWIWELYANQDNLVYDPELFDTDSTKHRGKVKQEVIANLGGYTITLREDAESPRQNTGISREGRTPLDNNKTAHAYLETLRQDPQYAGEVGNYPEEDIAYAITKLIEENLVVFNNSKNDASSTYSLGAYFPGSSDVPVLGWDAGNRRAVLVRNDPGSALGYHGATSLVRGIKKP